MLKQTRDGISGSSHVGEAQHRKHAVGQVLYRLGPGGEVRFRWSAFDHLAFDDVDPAVPLTQDPVDWTHADAASQAPDGSYLVSFRHLSQVVKIDAATGAVIWRLGGKRSSFTFPLGGPSFQHGARELPGGHVLLFDNGNGRATRQSRVVEYALDLQRMEARVAWQYAPSPPAFASDMGFAQRLANGDTLVTFGTLARVEEVAPTARWRGRSSHRTRAWVSTAPSGSTPSTRRGASAGTARRMRAPTRAARGRSGGRRWRAGCRPRRRPRAR